MFGKDKAKARQTKNTLSPVIMKEIIAELKGNIIELEIQKQDYIDKKSKLTEKELLAEILWSLTKQKDYNSEMNSLNEALSEAERGHRESNIL
jgi:hypothetical protein